MAKLNENKRIQKRRTADEMRNALHALVAGTAQRSIPPQVDDSDIILTDAIEELLEARQLIEDMRGFTAQWQTKLARK